MCNLQHHTAKRAADPASVPRRSEDPAEAVQGAERAVHGDDPQAAAEGHHQAAEGGADEEDGHAGAAVRVQHQRDDAAAKCEWLLAWLGWGRRRRILLSCRTQVSPWLAIIE